ncbi:DsrE family protein [Sphingopyxis sp.]|uniref:DsrE family protein n=1 Tax=Sphingopyxis sp. TaxID=1908224 RepID=UPI001DACD4EF|nr:DsrE family protein [Sphingopyxis sp.]MBW8294491.1 DsrE family protein [Sphingopyxis sp.]
MHESPSQPLLTIVTSKDPQTQLMALILTNAAMQKGAKPRILLCSAAGDLALKAPPASATAPLAPKGMSPQKLLQNLMANGVAVEVCAIYLPNRSLDKAALLDGIGVAMPDAVAEYILLENQKFLNF